jgi:DAK2 domain fusion protein YloV
MPSLDARTLRDVMSRFAEGLRTHRREIDSLNVFPVPDGDTGTNLLLTQEAVERSVVGLDGESMAEVGLEIARAALTGARGNSGVILSQVLGGFCRRLGQGEVADGTALAEALHEASGQADRAVSDPVDGTMLSVLADAARAAGGSAGDGAPPGLVADAALRAARDSLARTPRQLPSLREAGVVDAGGKGIVLFLDAIRAAVEDIPLSEEVGPLGPVGETPAADVPHEEAPGYGFEVMYLVECGDGAVPRLRERLRTLGDSVVVVGGGGLFNVHVHTDDPGPAVEEGIEAGRPRGIRVTSLDRQVAEACLAGTARGVRVAEADDERPAQTCGLVAIAAGDGAAELFRDLGAAVVTGGPDVSEEEVAGAIASSPSKEVVVLPNLEGLIPVARRAAEGRSKQVLVLPTGSVPEGLAAAAAFNPRANLEENASMGREAAARVTTVDVAEVAPDARTGPGRYVASVGGEIREAGEEPLEVAVAVLRGVVREGHEILTVLTGEPVTETDGVATALADAFPHLEIEVHRGGQAGHPLLIGVE